MPPVSPMIAPAMGSSGPASPPTGNPGLAAGGMSKLREAVNMLSLALPDLPLGSEPHKAAARAITDLSKSVPASEEIPGMQVTQLQGLQKQAQQSAPLVALMRAMGQQQQQPGAGGPTAEAA